jgi:hypothetical protein
VVERISREHAPFERYPGTASFRSDLLATPNYAYEKRQRELAKKRKAEEKRQRKLERTDNPAPADAPAVQDGAGAQPNPPAGTEPTR